MKPLDDELQPQKPARLDEVREPAAAPDYVAPYKYRACGHGVWIPEWPRLYIAVRCPQCFPEGPANCDPAEYGDYVAFGFLPQIMAAVKARGYIYCRQAGGEANVPYGILDQVAQNSGEFIRHEAREDLINACRLQMLRKRAVISKRAEVLGWTTAAMRRYVRTLCENLIKDAQQDSSEHRIERGKTSFSIEYNEDAEGEESPGQLLDVACDGYGKKICVTTGRIEEWPGPDMRMLDAARAIASLPRDLQAAIAVRYGSVGGESPTWPETAALLGFGSDAAGVAKARRRVAAAIRQVRKALGMGAAKQKRPAAETVLV